MIGNSSDFKIITMTKLLEKILFIDLTCHQIGKPTTEHPEFIPLWESLSKQEKDEYVKLSADIHEIWTYVNLPKPIVAELKQVNSIFEYHQQIKPVSEHLLTICKDFEITLKEELTAEFLEAAKRIMGKDYLTWYDA
jgi:hypothetical protein